MEILIFIIKIKDSIIEWQLSASY